MPPTASATTNALYLVSRHCPRGSREILQDFINEVVLEIDEQNEEIKDLRKKAGCEMCVSDDGYAIYPGGVGKHYYGDGIESDCFCVVERKRRERMNEEQSIHPIENEWVMKVGECIGELKETGFIRATYTDYMRDKEKEAGHKRMFHRIFVHLKEFDSGAGVMIKKNGVHYATAYIKGEEELVIGAVVYSSI